MPHFPSLVRLLVTAPHRVNGAGEIQLTPAEAAMLRASDFLTATAVGRWQIPALPPHLIRCYPWLAQLISSGPPARGTLEACSGVHSTSATAISPPPPRATGVAVAARGEPPRSRFGVDPQFRLRWHVTNATPDQRRILTSLLRRPDGRVTKRTLQQRLHRLPAARCNCALGLQPADWPAGTPHRSRGNRPSLTARQRPIDAALRTGINLPSSR